MFSFKPSNKNAVLAALAREHTPTLLDIHAHAMEAIEIKRVYGNSTGKWSAHQKLEFQAITMVLEEKLRGLGEIMAEKSPPYWDMADGGFRFSPTSMCATWARKQGRGQNGTAISLDSPQNLAHFVGHMFALIYLADKPHPLRDACAAQGLTEPAPYMLYDTLRQEVRTQIGSDVADAKLQELSNTYSHYAPHNSQPASSLIPQSLQNGFDSAIQKAQTNFYWSSAKAHLKDIFGSKAGKRINANKKDAISLAEKAIEKSFEKNHQRFVNEGHKPGFVEKHGHPDSFFNKEMHQLARLAKLSLSLKVPATTNDAHKWIVGTKAKPHLYDVQPSHGKSAESQGLPFTLIGTSGWCQDSAYLHLMCMLILDAKSIHDIGYINIFLHDTEESLRLNDFHYHSL